MRLSPPQLVIGDEDGFKNHDTFGAKEAGERLANVVADLEDHSVIVLDGQWGSGKSVFVQQWAGLMRQRGHPVVYLDAFAADHHEDAFFAILGALLRSLRSTSVIHDQQREPLVNKIKGAARLLMPAVPTVLDAAIGFPIGSVVKAVVDAAGTPDDASPASDASADSFLDSRLRRVQEQEESVEAFKKALNDVVENSPDSETPTRPLIFIIDELDRCKPSFALNVLERMKHIFAAEGICFVLVTHLEALAEMVRHTYGLEAANRYLDKFFHLRLDIDRLLASGNTDARTLYIRHIHKSLDVPEPAYAYTERAIQNLASIHDLPFRSLERVLLNVALYAKSGGYAGRQGHLDGVAELCVMKLANAKLYHDARNGQLTYEAVAEFLSLEDWRIALPTRQSIEEWWRVATGWSTEGADEDVVQMMNRRANLFGATVDQGDIHRRARQYGYDRWLSDICRDIDLFWQSGNA